MKKLKNFAFDTDVWINQGYKLAPEIKKSVALPLVVYCELIAGNIAARLKQELDQTFIFKRKQNLLLFPTVEDWTASANLIWRMRQSGKKLDSSGTALQNDIIIARSVMRWNDEDYSENRPPIRQLVTNNFADYRLVAKELNAQNAQEIKDGKLSEIEIIKLADFINENSTT